jgi:hypothetical protein
VIVSAGKVGNHSRSSNFNDIRLLTCGAVESKGLCSSEVAWV